MSDVTEHVILGNIEDASSAVFFEAWRITRILNCADEHANHKYPTHIPKVCIPLEDDEYPAAESQILAAAGQLEDWTRQGERVFVHCKAGVSRSPTVVMAWLIAYRKYSFDDAWCKVVKARPFVYPNKHFIGILKGMANHAKN